MISNTDKLRCVERELGYRRRVFARMVERGKMTERQSQNEIALMEAILADYQKLAALEELPLRS
jgi:hypothetical protein